MNSATAWILVGTAVGWLAWEFVLVYGRAKGKGWDTISIVLKDAGLRSCAVPYSVGVLCGHWWLNWPRSSSPWFAGWWVWASVLVLAAGSDLAAWRWADRPRETWPGWLRVLRYPGLWLLVGVFLGALCWPQRASL